MIWRFWLGDGGWVGDMHHELRRLGWSISLVLCVFAFEWREEEVAFALR